MEWLIWNRWAQAALVALVVAVVAIVADRRRQSRKKLDRVGYMPWPFLTVMAILVAVFSIALAITRG